MAHTSDYDLLIQFRQGKLGVNSNDRLSYREKSAKAYRALKRFYTLSEQELNLLEDASGIDPLIFRVYNDLFRGANIQDKSQNVFAHPANIPGISKQVRKQKLTAMIDALTTQLDNTKGQQNWLRSKFPNRKIKLLCTYIEDLEKHRQFVATVEDRIGEEGLLLPDLNLYDMLCEDYLSLIQAQKKPWYKRWFNPTHWIRGRKPKNLELVKQYVGYHRWRRHQLIHPESSMRKNIQILEQAIRDIRNSVVHGDEKIQTKKLKIEYLSKRLRWYQARQRFESNLTTDGALENVFLSEMADSSGRGSDALQDLKRAYPRKFSNCQDHQLKPLGLYPLKIQSEFICNEYDADDESNDGVDNIPPQLVGVGGLIGFPGVSPDDGSLENDPKDMELLALAGFPEELKSLQDLGNTLVSFYRTVATSVELGNKDSEKIPDIDIQIINSNAMRIIPNILDKGQQEAFQGIITKINGSYERFEQALEKQDSDEEFTEASETAYDDVIKHCADLLKKLGRLPFTELLPEASGTYYVGLRASNLGDLVATLDGLGIESFTPTSAINSYANTNGATNGNHVPEGVGRDDRFGRALVEGVIGKLASLQADGVTETQLFGTAVASLCAHRIKFQIDYNTLRSNQQKSAGTGFDIAMVETLDSAISIQVLIFNHNLKQSALPYRDSLDVVIKNLKSEKSQYEQSLKCFPSPAEQRKIKGEYATKIYKLWNQLFPDEPWKDRCGSTSKQYQTLIDRLTAERQRVNQVVYDYLSVKRAVKLTAGHILHPDAVAASAPVASSV